MQCSGGQRDVELAAYSSFHLGKMFIPLTFVLSEQQIAATVGVSSSNMLAPSGHHGKELATMTELIMANVLYTDLPNLRTS